MRIENKEQETLTLTNKDYATIVNCTFRNVYLINCNNVYITSTTKITGKLKCTRCNAILALCPASVVDLYDTHSSVFENAGILNCRASHGISYANSEINIFNEKMNDYENYIVDVSYDSDDEFSLL